MRIPWNIESHLREEQVGTEVADGVYQLCSTMTNMYLIEGDDGLTLVDAGLPAHMDLLQAGLERIEADISDINAVILTHIDPDHIGLAEPLRKEGIPVWVHEDGEEVALEGLGKPPIGFFLLMWRPAFVRFIRALMKDGMGDEEPIAEVNTFTEGQVLDVPGQPEVIHTPGHREGHCSFWLPDSRILFAGDALITLDIMSGKAVDPEPVRGGDLFNFNKEQQEDSARKLATLGQVSLLPGHVDPWRGDLGELYSPAD
ncbi:beta-lactamase domain protein [Haloterrigena turkmenica DSM 5511]|uniref:Beta-lactamase domain protein n=2 Tax=Haloterrigena turkmenica TaxID=62320 RepID=D2RYL5_HALTV|nr:beta-lactamase domain protein [Haloterrigena turkmenica DSM 5511]